MSSCHLKTNLVFAVFAAYFFITILGAIDRKLQCLNDIVEWCNNQSYPNVSDGITEFETTDVTDCGKYQQIHCKESSHGTRCTKNGSPWIQCNPDHEVKYKGTVLHKDSRRGIDNEICYTARKVNVNSTAVFKAIHFTVQHIGKTVGNIKSKVKGYESNVGSYVHKTLKNVGHDLEGIKDMITRSCFPFCG